MTITDASVRWQAVFQLKVAGCVYLSVRRRQSVGLVVTAKHLKTLDNIVLQVEANALAKDVPVTQNVVVI